LERQIVTLNDPAKRSEPRQVKMSDKLVAMMKPLLADTRLTLGFGLLSLRRFGELLQKKLETELPTNLEP
jgi:hypothetical protein